MASAGRVEERIDERRVRRDVGLRGRARGHRAVSRRAAGARVGEARGEVAERRRRSGAARASSAWDAREGRDHARMYALFEPAYREKLTFTEFLRLNIVRTRFDVVAPRVESIAAETARSRSCQREHRRGTCR